MVIKIHLIESKKLVSIFTLKFLENPTNTLFLQNKFLFIYLYLKNLTISFFKSYRYIYKLATNILYYFVEWKTQNEGEGTALLRLSWTVGGLLRQGCSLLAVSPTGVVMWIAYGRVPPCQARLLSPPLSLLAK